MSYCLAAHSKALWVALPFCTCINHWITRLTRDTWWRSKDDVKRIVTMFATNLRKFWAVVWCDTTEQITCWINVQLNLTIPPQQTGMFQPKLLKMEAQKFLRAEVLIVALSEMTVQAASVTLHSTLILISPANRILELKIFITTMRLYKLRALSLHIYH